MVYEMNRIDKGIIVDLEKYLEKKKRKIRNATHWIRAWTIRTA